MLRASESMPGLVLALLLVTPLAAQQANTTNAALSINGTGRLDDAGVPVPSSSQVSPPPVGSAALHHRLSPGTSLELRIDGPPLSPIILVGGTPTGPTPVGAYSFDLDLNTAYVLLDGLNPTSLLDFTSFTDFNGTWRFYLPQGLPPGLLDFTLQGLIYDPATPPFGLRFTSAITVHMDPGVEVLARNFVDGLNIVADNPQLLASTLSNGFRLEGLDAAQFVTLEAADSIGLFGGDGGGFAIMESIGHDSNPTGAVPATLPSTGQSFAAFVQILDSFGSQPCAPGVPGAERFRNHGLRFVEQGGVWRFAGDQRDAVVETELAFFAGTSNAQGVDVYLRFFVEDFVGRNGGIASASVTGPQLASISFNDVALSASPGTASMVLDDSGPDFSFWVLGVQLADTTLGTSRMPRVLGGASPDMYTVTINWNDGSPADSYVLGLRSSIDVNTNPAAVLAALPATAAAPGALLNMSGTATATVDLTFHVGSLTGTPEFGQMAVNLNQTESVDLFDLFPSYAPNTVQTMNVCAPFFTTGTPTSYFLQVIDLHGARYAAGGPIGL